MERLWPPGLIAMPLTRGHVKADDGQSALGHCVQYGGERRSDGGHKVKAKQAVHHQIVGVPDQADLRGQVGEEGDVHLLTLRVHLSEQGHCALTRVEDCRLVTLKCTPLTLYYMIEALFLFSFCKMPNYNFRIQVQNAFIVMDCTIYPSTRWTRRCINPANTKHLHNICTTSAQHCTNVIQMFCVCWVNLLWLLFQHGLTD